MTLNEFKGRCLLWGHAVRQTKMCLNIAFRAMKGSKQDFQENEQRIYQDKLKEFQKEHSGYEEGTLKLSVKREFDRKHERPFPYKAECYIINHISIKLAIVYFCQILTTGYGDQNASANETFRQEHMENILSRVFDTKEKRAKFEALTEKLKLARDKMIGHADAEAFNISHGTPVTTMGGVQNITEDLDLEYWHSFLEEFEQSITSYMNEQKDNYS